MGNEASQYLDISVFIAAVEARQMWCGMFISFMEDGLMLFKKNNNSVIVCYEDLYVSWHGETWNIVA